MDVCPARQKHLRKESTRRLQERRGQGQRLEYLVGLQDESTGSSRRGKLLRNVEGRTVSVPVRVQLEKFGRQTDGVTDPVRVRHGLLRSRFRRSFTRDGLERHGLRLRTVLAHESPGQEIALHARGVAIRERNLHGTSALHDERVVPVQDAVLPFGRYGDEFRSTHGRDGQDGVGLRGHGDRQPEAKGSQLLRDTVVWYHR